MHTLFSVRKLPSIWGSTTIGMCLNNKENGAMLDKCSLEVPLSIFDKPKIDGKDCGGDKRALALLDYLKVEGQHS